MQYIIGIDGGGTKTEAVAYSLDGTELSNCITGFGNMVAGRDEAVENIIASLKGCTSMLKKDDLCGIYLGIAGAEAGDNELLLKETIKGLFGTKIEVMNDGELALRAMLKGEDGILTVAGTGSIAFGINGEMRERCGGYGHILGDEGSGYKISVEAFKRITVEDDYNLPLSRLSKEILDELGLKGIHDLLGYVYSSSKKEIASIAPIVSRLAEDSEENAVRILKEQGRKLAETTFTVFKKLKFDDGCNIAVKGSVIQKARVLRKSYEDYLRSRIEDLAIFDEDVSSTKGAFYIYNKNNE